MAKPSKEQLESLSKQIKKDQKKTSPAEKRVKLNVAFKKAVKKAAARIVEEAVAE